MLPAAPEADELQQLPLELPRYLLVALRESGGHRAYALLLPAAVARIIGGAPFYAPQQKEYMYMLAEHCPGVRRWMNWSLDGTSMLGS